MATVRELISGVRIADAEARGKVRALLTEADGTRDRATGLARQIGSCPFIDSLRFKSGVGLRRAFSDAAQFVSGQVPGFVHWGVSGLRSKRASLSGAYLYACHNPMLEPAWIADAEPLVLRVNYLTVTCDQPHNVYVSDGSGAVIFCIHALERLASRRRDLSVEDMRRGLIEAAADSHVILMSDRDGGIEYSEIDIPAFGGCFRGFVRTAADVSLGGALMAWVDVRTFYDSRLLNDADGARLEAARRVLVEAQKEVQRSAKPAIGGFARRLHSEAVRALFRPATRYDWLQSIDPNRAGNA